MCLRVVPQRGPVPDEPVGAPTGSSTGARALGAAFQKINFLRDLGADIDGAGPQLLPGRRPAGSSTDAQQAAILADDQRRPGRGAAAVAEPAAAAARLRGRRARSRSTAAARRDRCARRRRTSCVPAGCACRTPVKLRIVARVGAGGGARRSRAARRMTAGRVVVIGGGIAGLATAALLAREGYAGDPARAARPAGRAGGHAGRSTGSGSTPGRPGTSCRRSSSTSSRCSAPRSRSSSTWSGWTPATGCSSTETAGVGAGRRRRPTRRPTGRLFERIEPGAGDAMRRYLASASTTPTESALDRFLYTTFARPDAACSARDVLRARRDARRAADAARSTRSPRTVTRPAAAAGARLPGRVPRLLARTACPSLYSPDEPPRPRGRRRSTRSGGFTGHRGVVAARAAGGRASPDRHGGDRRSDAAATRSGGAAAPPSAPRGRVQAPADDWPSTSSRPTSSSSAADLHHTETELLPPELRRYPRSGGTRTAGPGASWSILGVRGALPELAHHSLFFTDDWRQLRGHLRHAGLTSRTPGVDRTSAGRSATRRRECRPGRPREPVRARARSPPTRHRRGGMDGAGIRPSSGRRPAISTRSAPGRASRTCASGSWCAAGRARPTSPRPQRLARQRPGPGAHPAAERVLPRRERGRARSTGCSTSGWHDPGIGLPMCLISAELVIKRLRGDRWVGPSSSPPPVNPVVLLGQRNHRLDG